MAKNLDIRPERVDILIESNTAMLVTIEVFSDDVPSPMDGYVFQYVAENDSGSVVVSGSTSDGRVIVQGNVVQIKIPVSVFDDATLLPGAYPHGLYYFSDPQLKKKMFSGFLKVYSGV